MTANISPNEQSPGSPRVIDLDDLQHRDIAGEPLHVMSTCANAVTEAMVADTARLHSGAKEYSPRQMARNRIFWDTFNAGVPHAPDIPTFEWRLQVFAAHAMEALPSYIAGTRDGDPFMAKRQTVANIKTLEYLHLYCEIHPEMELEAVKTWLNSGIHIDHSEAQASITQGEVSGQQKLQRAQRNKVIERDLYGRSQGKPLGITGMQFILEDLIRMPYRYLDEKNLSAIHDILEFREVEPGSVNRLLRQSLDATAAFIQDTLQDNPELKDTELGIMHRLTARQEQRARQEGEKIPYSWLIKLANVMTPALVSQSGLELNELKPDDLADYPKAVDRILSLVLASATPSLKKSGAIDLARGVADCIKLAAWKGADYKKNQRILTLGDIVLRYPDLTPQQQREMAEKLQASKGTAAVHGLYREMSARKQKRTRYRGQQPGYGVFS